MSPSLPVIVAFGAYLVTLLAVTACCWAIGRTSRGGAGALVAAVVAVGAGALGQWELLGPKDVSSTLAPLWFGSLVEWADRLSDAMRQDLGITGRRTALDGPLFNLAIVPKLAAAGLVFGGPIGWLLNSFAPAIDSYIAGAWLGASMSRIYRRLFWTMAVIGMSLAVLPAFRFDDPGMTDAVRTAPYALWTVPAFAFAILWFACEPPPDRRSVRQPDPERPDATGKHDLASLFESYKADFAGHLLRSRPASPPWFGEMARADRRPPRAGPPHDPGPTVDRILTVARGRSIDPGDAWGDDLAEQLEGAWGDPATASTDAATAVVLVHDAAPTALTFLVLAELALSAQDRGMTTLVVTDEGGVARVGAELGNALDDFAAQETHRVYTGDGQPSGYYDVVVSSVQRLETEVLSSRDSSLTDAVHRIGLVVVIDLTRIDSALLRLRFVHLSSLVGSRRPLALVQSEPRIGLDTQIKSLLAPLGSYDTRRLPALARDTERQWLMVWRNDTAFLEALFQTDLERPQMPAKPLEIAPFLLVRAWRRGIGAAFHDIAGRVDRDLWEETLPSLMGLKKSVLTPRDRAGISDGRLPYPSEQDRVLVIEDLGNLAEAVSYAANFRQIDEHLLHILSHDYPLRDFFADRLGPAIESGDHASLDAYLPIAPDPEGGPAELALAIATVVLEKGRFAVSEGDLLDRIGMFRSDGPVAEFAGVTRDGLAELLADELDCRPSIVARRLPGHESEFVFNNVDGLSLDPGYLIALERDTRKDQTDAWLDRGDDGLTYAPSTVIQQFGKYFTVEAVSREKVFARTASDLPVRIGKPLAGAQRARNRPRYRFTRLYDLDMAPDDVEIVKIESHAGHLARAALRVLVRGAVERTSIAFVDYPELERPLAWGLANWKGHSRRVAMPRGIRIHARYTLSPSSAEGRDLSRLALTLAATLQDVLASIFPPNGERLAVMSPQSEAAIAPLLSETDPIERFPCDWLPRLISRPTGSEPFGDLFHAPIEQALFVDSTSRLIGAARTDRHGTRRLDDTTVRRFTEGDRFLDLVLVEDGSHDLGCLRALFSDASWTHMTDVWRDYLEWCVENKDDERFYYRHGAARVPAVFDFVGARDFLSDAVGRPAGAGA